MDVETPENLLGEVEKREGEENLEGKIGKSREMATAEVAGRAMLANAQEQGWPEETLDLLRKQAEDAGEKAGQDYEKKTAEQVAKMNKMLSLFGGFLANPTANQFVIIDNGKLNEAAGIPTDLTLEDRNSFAAIVGAPEIVEGNTDAPTEQHTQTTGIPNVGRTVLLDGRNPNRPTQTETYYKIRK